MRSQIVQFMATVTDGIALPPNPGRRSLRVSAYGFSTTTVRLQIAFGADSSKNGFTVSNTSAGTEQATTQIVPFTLADVGEQLKESVHLSTSSGSVSVTLLEGFD